MSSKFRPQFEALEGREVPAAFSFRMPDGTVGSGRFATPELDPDQAAQTFVVDDLTVTYGGAVYVVAAGALADYEEGELVGLTATATGAGPDIALAADVAFVDGVGTADVYLDGAATQVTFDITASGSSAVLDKGAISYDLAYQSVTLTNFKLNIAGRNLTEADLGVFTSPPTAQFAFGVFQGLTFVANTAALGNFPYASISLNGLSGAAQAVGGQLFEVNAEAPTFSVSLDFSEVTTGQAYRFTILLETRTGQLVTASDLAVGATTTRAQLIQAIVTGFSDTVVKTTVTGNVLTIQTPGKNPFGKFSYQTYKPDGTVDNTLKGPTFISSTNLTEVKVNGTRIDPH